MIIDHRTYDFHPGKMKAWIDVYEKYALPVQQKHLGNFIGFFTTEVGPINQVTFMWGFTDAGDRERRRREEARVEGEGVLREAVVSRLRDRVVD